MAATSFKHRCEKVADHLGIGVDFYDDSRLMQAFEDDGTLHVVKDGLRACFNVSNSQNSTGKEMNEKTVAVLTGLGMRRLVGKKVLVDESEGDTCPHCGEPL